MLNKLWPFLIIIAIIFSIFTGNIENLNNSIFNSAESAVQLTLTFIGTMCLWNGIMNVAYKTNLIEKINKLINPIINLLFPEIKKNKKIKENVSMNIVANILGLGNAATPLGLKAMQSLQENNKNKNELSNSMIMLIVLNTASLQIIPTTVLAIRNSLGSTSPTTVVLPIWIATIMAAMTAILITKILIKVRNKNEFN